MPIDLCAPKPPAENAGDRSQDDQNAERTGFKAEFLEAEYRYERPDETEPETRPGRENNEDHKVPRGEILAQVGDPAPIEYVEVIGRGVNGMLPDESATTHGNAHADENLIRPERVFVDLKKRQCQQQEQDGRDTEPAVALPEVLATQAGRHPVFDP